MNRFKQSNAFLVILSTIFSLLLFSHCSDDNDVEGENAKLVGTWILSSVDAEFMIDGKTMLDYLVDEGELTEIEAELIEVYLKALLEDELDDGEIIIKSDHTYVVDFGDGIETGTWSYDSSTKYLSINPDDIDEDPVMIMVKSITSTTLTIEQSETIEEEIEEGIPIEIEATIEMVFTKM